MIFIFMLVLRGILEHNAIKDTSLLRTVMKCPIILNKDYKEALDCADAELRPDPKTVPQYDSSIFALSLFQKHDLC